MRMECQKLWERSEDWLKYAVGIRLCRMPAEALAEQKKAALADERIRAYLRDVARFHETLVSNHKNPALPAQKLLFLLDLGFGTEVPEIHTAVGEILKHQDENGVYQSLANFPVHFGGTGRDTFTWCLCDAPWLLLALIRAGVEYERYIKKGVDHLASLCRDNGFPCAVSREAGKFRGPGRKDDCCPYATLIMAELLAAVPEYRESAQAKTAAETLMYLWAHSYEQHPYMFFTGRDFRKLKAPSGWYDVVSVAGVLSRFPFVYGDPRFQEMIGLIKSKQDADGFFTPESIYTKLKGWDFAQKKEPSPYLTYLCLRIFDRLETERC